jgi:hypothetical protein
LGKHYIVENIRLMKITYEVIYMAKRLTISSKKLKHSPPL